MLRFEMSPVIMALPAKEDDANVLRLVEANNIANNRKDDSESEHDCKLDPHEFRILFFSFFWWIPLVKDFHRISGR